MAKPAKLSLEPAAFEMPRWYPKTPIGGLAFSAVVSLVLWAISSGAVYYIAKAMLAQS